MLIGRTKILFLAYCLPPQKYFLRSVSIHPTEIIAAPRILRPTKTSFPPKPLVSQNIILPQNITFTTTVIT